MNARSAGFLLTFLFIFTGGSLLAQPLRLVTWNIQDLGRTKDAQEIYSIAQLLRDYDIVAIQEVVGLDPAGARAVAKIADELNRMGSKWDYSVSDRTQSPSSHISERYAYLWKTSKVDLLSDPYLDQELAEVCFREPYIAQFSPKGSKEHFFVVNFHSRKHDQQPEQEIKYFSLYTQRLAADNVLIAGDFNLDEKHTVWNPLYKKGYTSAIRNTPTTLKRKCARGNYLNYAIDNIYFNTKCVKKLEAGRVDFVRNCGDLSTARGISDHLPVYLVWEAK